MNLTLIPLSQIGLIKIALSDCDIKKQQSFRHQISPLLVCTSTANFGLNLDNLQLFDIHNLSIGLLFLTAARLVIGSWQGILHKTPLLLKSIFIGSF